MCRSEGPPPCPASASGEASGSAVGGSDSAAALVVEVWELQRRLTLFHTTWAAPFLPHDGVKQWRWVTRSYTKHEWTQGAQEAAAKAEAPPLEAAAGWRVRPRGEGSGAEEGWAVVDTPNCHEDGWQYAVDFYGSDSWWVGAPSVCCCRRRLWRCTFEPKDVGGLAAPRMPLRSAAAAAAAPGGGEGGKSGGGGGKAASAAVAAPLAAPAAAAEAAVATGGAAAAAEATAADDLLPARPGELRPLIEASEVPKLDLREEVDKLFAEEWSSGCFVMDLLAASDISEIEVAPWAAAPPAAAAAGGGGGEVGQVTRSATRQVSARLIVPPAPMAPKTTRATITYRILAEERAAAVEKLTIEADFVVHDTPYCDCFHVHEQISFQPSSAGTALTKQFGIVFSKKTFVQSMIDSNTTAQQKKSADFLLDFVRRRAGGEVAAAAPVAGGTATGANSSETPSPLEDMKEKGYIEIWELQRRVTLFHKTWGAPFLPHDEEKQWRWVDMSYKRHPWVKGDMETASSRAFPVLELPEGWKRREGTKGWSVAPAPGVSDSEGWQYAVDLYASNEFWFADSTWFHCRRRLWRMDVEGPAEEQGWRTELGRLLKGQASLKTVLAQGWERRRSALRSSPSLCSVTLSCSCLPWPAAAGSRQRRGERRRLLRG